MKRKIIGIALLSTMVVMTYITGCNSDDSKSSKKEPKKDTISSSASENNNNDKTTTAETTEATENSSDNGGSGNSSGSGGSSYDRGDYKAVSETKKNDKNDIIFDNLRLVPAPDAEPTHSDINFGLITDEDGETFDIFECSVTEFEEITGASAECTLGLRHNSDDFFFRGVPYSVGEWYLELITPQNAICTDNTTSKAVLHPCKIKGIGFDDYTDYNIHGVTFGMSSIQVEQVLGKGLEGCTFVDVNDGDKEKYNVIYKSKTTTLVVTYVHGKTYTGEEVGVVANLFVLKND